jgi:hypothetical protein
MGRLASGSADGTTHAGPDGGALAEHVAVVETAEPAAFFQARLERRKRQSSAGVSGFGRVRFVRVFLSYAHGVGHYLYVLRQHGWCGPGHVFDRPQRLCYSRP